VPPPERKAFALTGRSHPVDPRTDAVRPDIADVRLAARVFAPHYAAPMRRTLVADATLRAARGAEAEPLAQLAKGDAFDLLDVTGAVAWGIVVESGLVGYVDAAALDLA
jgi:hypothetical protein